MNEIIVALITAISTLIPIVIQNSISRKTLLKELQALAISNKKDNLKLQIMRFIDHDPNNIDTIYKCYDEYKSLLGNSYIDSIILDWERSRKVKP